MSAIFVFGSNKAGRHGKGAALYAARNHHAENGVGEGLTGTAYAIPTKDENLKTLSLLEISDAVGRFVDFAAENSGLEFHLTPIGTGLAGHSKRDIWSILSLHGLPSNVLLTASWVSEQNKNET